MPPLSVRTVFILVCNRTDCSPFNCVANLKTRRFLRQKKTPLALEETPVKKVVKNRGSTEGRGVGRPTGMGIGGVVYL